MSFRMSVVIVAVGLVGPLVSPGVAGSLGEGVLPGGSAGLSWSVSSLSGVEKVLVSVPGLDAAVEADVRVVDPGRASLDRVAASLSVGDIMNVEMVPGDVVAIRVDYVLIEREVSDGPGSMVVAKDWLPRFQGR